MKMPEDNDNGMLEGFFTEMKEKDKNLQIPPFPKQKKSKSWMLVPIGIAASLLLLMLLITDSEPNYTIEHDLIIITMEKGADQELEFDIKTASSIDVWEAPTSSLLTEF